MSLNDSPPLYGLVLAGGGSTRMGADKAAIEYHGEPEVVRTYKLLRELCSLVYVSVRHHQLDDPLYAEVEKIADDLPGNGPAIGLLSAMHSHPDAAWLIVACDMPLLDRAALERLIEERDADRAATAFMASDGGVEPLCAIYEPVCRAAFSDAVARGYYGIRRIIRDWDVKLVPPNGNTTTSANTPEERAEMRAAIQQNPLLKT
jgi:molybdopterin-guanine dinucleotide biosynthesis protein A